jgi:hypothetical protein
VVVAAEAKVAVVAVVPEAAEAGTITKQLLATIKGRQRQVATTAAEAAVITGRRQVKGGGLLDLDLDLALDLALLRC